MPAATPAPPYYAAIFTSRMADTTGYDEMSQEMGALARTQDGFLGIESARDANGLGITVSYWASLQAIAAWKANADHLDAQREGRARWYDRFQVRIARVERAYGFEAH